MDAEANLRSVEQFWSRNAAMFDESADHGLTDPRVRAAWRDALTSWLPDTPATVADLGCGTGSLSLLAAELGCKVHGIDLSLAMIDIAKDKAAASGAINAQFDVGDASEPSIEPSSLDVVMTRHLLWTLTDPAQALERWAKLLRPTGRAILIEGVWGDPVPEDDPRRQTFPWAGGVPAKTLIDALSPLFGTVELSRLSDTTELWGKPVSDERYAVVARDLLH